MTKNNIIEKIITEITEKRGKLLDDFLRAYLDSRFDKYKNKKELIKRLKLVEVISNDRLKTTWHFELKRGKLLKD